MADNSGAIDLSNLSQEEQERLADMAEETGTEAREHEGSYPGDQHPEDNKRKVLTAFLVLVNYDGNPEVMAFDDPDLLVQTAPTADLIYGAVQTIAKDLAASETAQAAAMATAQLMAQQARAMQEQMQAQAIQQRLAQGGLRG